MSNKAVIAGASGLTGGYLLNHILNEPHYDEVLIIVRKQLPIEHKKLIQLVVDFDKMDDVAASITGDVIFCCLGTTKAKTSDKALYIKIEHDYPVQLAEIAFNNGFKQYHFMSSVDADANAGGNYLKWKGKTENDIQKFKFHALHIYRPSLLTGNRNEFRLVEKLAEVFMKLIDPLLFGSFKKYVSIPAATVARAMYKQSLKTEEGVFVHPSHHIKQLA
ncbi:NAD-dependent epimerase/dehydratase family protein [Mucilaginibacter terrae]|uniref:Uncharacterized protein YbjT (DUF2867 family) n=1 Tax=Mucilaginibacter terrae TaxID=1955052 RepID=A0ABU3GV49_9SPHI|nr:NAD(P)H-binding protein [Mucilaginibacter terrae]MDT3403643.1 uncharacterized protein YbjT (DUF2867 family) [Mucilaginibacter terrae]